jgi:hypothetical protein
MRILTVSDVVSNSVYNVAAKDRFPDIGLVLGCGDLPAYYLEFIVSIFDAPLYYVMGNHADEHHTQSYTSPPSRIHPMWGEPSRQEHRSGYFDDEPAHGPRGCTNLDGKIVNHKGLLIGGLQGSMWYNGGPYQYTEQDMSLKILKLRPKLLLSRVRYGRAIDILITHSPPAGIHDDSDVAHQGFRCFLSFMDEFAPRYLVHGHKHVYLHGEQTVTQYNRTTVINTYGFRTLELETT